MRRFSELVAETQRAVSEVFPWDLAERMDTDHELMVLDIREPDEFAAMRIKGSINVPRGVLEPACEYGYEETEPVLVEAREKPIVLVCRSGNRSILAARTMQILGYQQVWSLKTGLRGWNDYEQPLVDGASHVVPIEQADEYFLPRIRPEQLKRVA